MGSSDLRLTNPLHRLYPARRITLARHATPHNLACAQTHGVDTRVRQLDVNVTLLAGGYGGARMAHGFALLGDAVTLSVVGNTGDDIEVHGLHVSPDLDTVMYTLATLANDRTGWGVRNETWSASAMLGRYGEPTWFSLGDRDLATHVVRSARLHDGESLTAVMRRLCDALGVSAALLPMSDDPVRTKVLTEEGWLDFQDYFVRRGHRDRVTDIRFDGVENARATPQVSAAIDSADLIVIAPSNPYVSVAPILSVAGMLDALLASPAPVVAVSPIIGGEAVRGPAAQMMRSLGTTPSATGVAELYTSRYSGLVDTLVIDRVDEAQADAVRNCGITAAVADTVIADEAQRRRLALDILSFCGLAQPD